MATVETIIYREKFTHSSELSTRATLIVTGCLAVVAVLVQGYHPYAEDGGLYLTGIKKILDPSLYPSLTGFVTAQIQFSLFAPAFAALVRATHIHLMAATLLIYIASIWSSLVAAWMLAARCFNRIEACIGAALLLALWLAMPVAGTSLMLMDPYVTARSISTPCGLFALVGTVDLHHYLRESIPIPRLKMACYAASLLIAEAAHPLMATYAFAGVILFLAWSLPNRIWRITSLGVLTLFAFAAATCIYSLSPSQSQEYIRAAQTRAYWFIDTWQWYEVFGLVAPLLVIAAIARFSKSAGWEVNRLIAQSAVLAGAIGIAIAILFAHLSSASYSVARLQPLRIFQSIYLLMIVLLGGYLGVTFLKRNLWRWAALFVMGGGGMLVLQLQTYPNSAHIEFPGTTSQNDWEQGFKWISENTPRDALFALDAKYIAAPHEDSQNFRAIAERSALPDYSKDGGLAAIAPALARQWNYGENLQEHLNRESDFDRERKLAPLGVSWIVLSPGVPTDMACPYSNQSMKVCRLSHEVMFSPLGRR